MEVARCWVQAMVRNGEYLGDRYVRLLHVPRQEMEEQVRVCAAASVWGWQHAASAASKLQDCRGSCCCSGG